MADSIVVEISHEDLKEKMRYDCVTFLAFYIQDELDMEVPALHEEIWAELVEMIHKMNIGQWTKHFQKVFCVPRGHSKSTLIKLAVILFLRYSPLSFVVYVSLTKPLALSACKDIVAWLESENDAALWGKPVKIQNNETMGLFMYIIGTPKGQKKIILKTLSADQKVRGTLQDNRRPQMMVFDDCEDNDTAATAESQAKFDTWFMGNALKASAKVSVRIVLGNMINSRTMLYRLSKDPAWNPTVYGAIIRDKVTGILKPLWPGLWTLEDLLKDYQDYRSKGVGHVWIYEMMNMTQDSVFKINMANVITIPLPNPEDVEYGIITLDPAFGQKAYNDESALAVHAKIRGQVVPFTIDSRKGRWTEDGILDNFLELSYYWNLATWGIESVAAQKLLVSLFRLKLKDRKVDPDLFLMIPLPSGGTAKSSRILSYANSIGVGSWGMSETQWELIQKLEVYDPQNPPVHDDLEDSGAYGPIAFSMAGTQIQDALRFKSALALMQSRQQASPVHQGQLVPF